MAYMFCPHCGEEIQGIKVRTDTETLTLKEIMARLAAVEGQPPQPHRDEKTDAKDLLDGIAALQQDLRYQLQAFELAVETPDRLIRALAATYELLEYLLAVEEDRAMGREGCSVDDLDNFLASVIADIESGRAKLVEHDLIEE